MENKFFFNNIKVDFSANLIIVSGKERRVEPRLMALLAYLAQHDHQVLSRQEIAEAVWSDVIVGEDSITQAIFALRNALNDDAKHPQYIETIPKKGYRFLARLEKLTSHTDHKDDLQILPSNAGNTSQWRHHKITTIIFVALISLGIIGHAFKPQPYYKIANIQPVTKMLGAECCMAINSDKKMAFINYFFAAEQSDIYVKDLTTGLQERITNDDYKKGLPIWRDNHTLIYPRCMNNECQIIMQGLHSTPLVIHTASAFIGEIARNPVNSSLIIFNAQHPAGSDFIVLNIDSGETENLRDHHKNLPARIIHPLFSPDASLLYFVSADKKAKLMSLNLQTSEINLITDFFDDINSFSIGFRQELMIAGKRESTSGIWLLDKPNSKPHLFHQDLGNQLSMFPLKDPTDPLIYYQNLELNQDIGVIADNISATHKYPELNSTGTDSWAVLSKDKQSLFFASERSGAADVWRYDLHKKRAEPITNAKIPRITKILPSPDGYRLGVMYIDDAQPMLDIFSVYTFAVFSTQSGELLVKNTNKSVPLSWSNDGKYIYTKELHDGLPVLIRRNSKTLDATEIRKNAGLFAQETADGNALVFIDYEQNALVEHNFSAQKETTLLRIDIDMSKLEEGQVRMNAAATALFIIKNNALWEYPLNATASKKLMAIPKNVYVTYIEDDGSMIMYHKQMPPVSDIMKIELH